MSSHLWLDPSWSPCVAWISAVFGPQIWAKPAWIANQKAHRSFIKAVQFGTHKWLACNVGWRHTCNRSALAGMVWHGHVSRDFSSTSFLIVPRYLNVFDGSVLDHESCHSKSKYWMLCFTNPSFNLHNPSEHLSATTSHQRQTNQHNQPTVFDPIFPTIFAQNRVAATALFLFLATVAVTFLLLLSEGARGL